MKIFIISIIYTIHLIHLGSRKSDLSNDNQSKIINKLQRADIIDKNEIVNNNYININTVISVCKKYKIN